MNDAEVRLDKYRLKANASFTIREGWLTKGLRHVIDNPRVFLADNAVDMLGIGSAMVKSLRFWMQASGLCSERNTGIREQALTELGQVIFRNDLYLEDPFSLYMVHYNIVSHYEWATVWYLLFNHCDLRRFTKDRMTEVLLAVFREIATGAFSDASFRDDCGYALKTYVADTEQQRFSPEDNMLCPLTSLGLYAKPSKDTYEYTIPPQSRLHALAVLYVIIDRMQGRDSISLEHLLRESCNVGRTFHLDMYRLNVYLDQLQADGYLSIQRTAGLNMVYPKTDMSPAQIAQSYYRR